MRLEQLEYLVAVAETNSMTAASNLLHVTHQNISKALKQLEEELAVTLLTRSKQGVILTKEGREIYLYCRQILTLKDKIKHIAPCSENDFPPTKRQSSVREVLRVLIPTSFYNMFLLVVEKFEMQYPGLKIFLEGKEPMFIIRRLLSASDDAQIMFIMMEQQHFLSNQQQLLQSYDIFVLEQGPLVLITAEYNLVNNLQNITLGDLKKIPLIFRHESFESDNFFLDCLQRYGFRSTNITASGVLESCNQAMLNGTAAVVGTAYSFRIAATTTNIAQTVMTPIKPKIIVSHLMLVQKKATPSAQKFAQFFKEVFKIDGV